MKRRNGLMVMAGLIGMVKPLLIYMIIAIIMGCIGNLCATFITVMGGYGILSVAGHDAPFSLKYIFIIAGILAVLRGILRYSEQACNHFIAFKLLARIRHKVFASLRKLAPAKLDGREKGNLISIITSDIELLEVFYAHTISPIAIAIVTSVIMCIYIGLNVPALAIVALVSYILVGAIIPYLNGRDGRDDGTKYRREFGELNSAVLDNLYGLDEILQYAAQDDRIAQMTEKTNTLEKTSKLLKNKETVQKIKTDTVILLAGAVSVFISANLIMNGQAEFDNCLIAIIALLSSFGPTAAISALSNNLNQTLASGDRVLNLLEEEPVVYEIENGKAYTPGEVVCDDISFEYSDSNEGAVLKNFNIQLTPGKIYGIHGKSGCGKSTLLKLLMRFYETDSGKITYNGEDVNDITTQSLRKKISYVTQETFLFQDTILNNIRLGNDMATREEVIEAAKRASVHEFIQSLPEGYDTKISELGESVSGGERQRIGIARALLHDSDIIYLDEPTSNIDSLNEAIILKSLYKERAGKTVLLVSHRKSTMGIADTIINM